MKRTGWYRGDQKPVRVGVYERDYATHPDESEIVFFSFWDGESFGFNSESPLIAAKRPMCTSARQDLPWRGLAKEPK